MTDAEMKKLAKYIAEELRSKPLLVETRTEHEARLQREREQRLEAVAFSKAITASQRAQQQLSARVPSAQS